MHFFKNELCFLSLQIPSSFGKRLNSKLPKKPEESGGYAESSLAYDAVWAIALALNKTIIGMEEKELNRDNKQLGIVSY